MSENGTGEQPDGSVGRYVRERWGAAEPPTRSFGRRRRPAAGDAAGPEGTERPPVDDTAARPVSAAERMASAPAPGRAAVGTQTPPAGSAWGSEVPEVDDELVDEIDPSTPPHGLDLSALRRTREPEPAADPAPREEEPAPAQRRPTGTPDGGTAHDVGPDDTGLYRAGADPEPWWDAPTPADDGPDGELIWRRPDHADPGPAAGPSGSAPSADPAAASPEEAPAASDDASGPDRTAATAVSRPAAGDTRRADDARNGSVRVPPGGSAPDRERPRRSGWDRDPAGAGRARQGGTAAKDGAPAEGGVAAQGGAAANGRRRTSRPRWTAPEAVEPRTAAHRRGDSAHGGGLDLAPSRGGQPTRRPPRSGWRRMVYVLSRGLINPGESPAELRERELVARLNRPLGNAHKIAMLSLKGGVGKTTVTATLGATFAAHRGDRVVAVDANPDRGTLSQKIPLETTATVRHLLRDSGRVRRYSDVRAYTSQGASRLEVLASEQDPAVSEAFSEDDYRRAVDLLEHFYNLVLTDCGTGLMHSAMYGVLGVADQLVIVSSGSIDGARSASATLDWLDAHGYTALVGNAVVVINSVFRRAGGVDLDRVAEHFAGRCRAVVRVPFDPHLEEGTEIDLDRLEAPTRTALLELAAAVADGFPV